MTLTHRERVLIALDHREPDRVPWDLWATPEVMDRLRTHFNLPDEESVLRRLDVDLRTFYGPSTEKGVRPLLPVGPEGASHKRGLTPFSSPDAEGLVADLWGVKRKVVKVEGRGFEWSYKHLAASPLATAVTVADVESYGGWPDPAKWDYSGVAGTCRGFAGCAVVNAGDRLDRTAQLKCAMYLRGVEQIFMDLIQNPAVAEAIFERIYVYFMEYNRRIFEAAQIRTAGQASRATPSVLNPKSKIENPKLSLIDIFMMGDDFGSQHGPLVSVPMWRRFFKKRFRDYIDLAHRFGIRVMHHTCGSVRDLIGEFIDCGLDVLQSLQPQAAGMDLAELKREFGRHIAFHGSVDIQGALPHGSPDDVRAEVKAKMAAGKPGGGFIISTAHNIQPDTPTENIVALFEACREFGDYAS
jgi:uroporphyrinogen decarboxylase